MVQHYQLSFNIFDSGLIVVMVLAFFWIFMMQFLARYMIWLSILAIFALNAAGLWYSVSEYTRLTTPANQTYLSSGNKTASLSAIVKFVSETMPEDGARSMKYLRADSDTLKFDLNLNEKLKDELNTYLNNPTTWMVSAIVLGVLLVIVSSTMLCLCRRIQLAIAVIEEASQ